MRRELNRATEPKPWNKSIRAPLSFVWYKSEAALFLEMGTVVLLDSLALRLRLCERLLVHARCVVRTRAYAPDGRVAPQERPTRHASNFVLLRLGPLTRVIVPSHRPMAPSVDGIGLCSACA